MRGTLHYFGPWADPEDLRPDDFEKVRVTFATKWGPVRIGNDVNRVRIIFNYALKAVAERNGLSRQDFQVYNAD
jgi:hypothetical protein